MDSETKFIDILTSLEALVVFIGNGASMEGFNESEQPFPSFSQLIVSVLSNAGKNENGEITTKNAFKHFSLFEKYINNEQDDACLYLKNYLNGKPGTPHYHFVNLITCLFEIEELKFSNLIFVTTNYDTMIEQALENSGIKYVSESLPKDKSLFSHDYLEKIQNHLQKGTPVVLHIFGDLESEAPIFFQKEMEFSELEKGFFKRLFQKSILSIGYSFYDQVIKDIICAQNNIHNKPLYNVSPKEINNENLLDKPRKIYNYNMYFKEFAIKLICDMYVESGNNKQPSRQNIFLGLKARYEQKIQNLNFNFVYDLEFLKWRIELVNSYSINRIIDLTSDDILLNNMDKLYVYRDGIHWDTFLKSVESIGLVLGEAGMGKSTYFHMLAKQKPLENIFMLLLIPARLKDIGFIEYLANNFLCKSDQLETLFDHFDSILKHSDHYFIILVDAINELAEKAISVKSEIEEFFKKKWNNIKIVYSCRTYYWKNNLRNEYHNVLNYFPSVELKHFDDKQLLEAYSKYKSLYSLSGDLNNTTVDFRNKLKDPLMLRLLSEGYQNRSIPAFAPAVKIYSEYLKFIENKSNKSNIIDTLVDIGNIFWEIDMDDLLGTMSIHKDYLKPLNQDHIKFLKESNILYEEHHFVQFHYERLFEFILGYSILVKNGWEHPANNLNASTIYQLWIICIENNKPYTYTFAIKSALIYLSRISDIKQKDLIENGNILAELLDINKVDPNIDSATADHFRHFVLEVIRELVTELDSQGEDIENSRIAGYEKLKETLGQKIFYDVILQIGRDDFRSVSYQLELLCADNPEIKRQVIFNLLYLVNDEDQFKVLEKEILHKANSVDKDTLDGLVYLLPLYIKNFRIIEKMSGKTLINYVQDKLIKIRNNISTQPGRTSFQNKLINSVQSVFEKEGNGFFGHGTTPYDGIAYSWGMGEEEKNLAQSLASLLSFQADCNLIKHNKLSIRFFASEIMHLNDINAPYESADQIERVRSWEYFIARFILVKTAKYEFPFVISFLEEMMKENMWLTFNFALSVMEAVLRTIHINNDNLYELGLEKMMFWVDENESKHPEVFYQRLSTDNPLDVSMNPLSQTANTIIQKTPERKFSFLDERVKSGNLQKAKLALLSLRKVVRKFPEAGKTSFEIAWGMRDKYDEEFRNWLDLSLKELSYVQPKMVYDIFVIINATAEDKNRINNIKASPKTNEYNIIPFFQWLMSDIHAMQLAVSFYSQMIHSDKDIFFKEKLVSLFRDN